MGGDIHQRMSWSPPGRCDLCHTHGSDCQVIGVQHVLPAAATLADTSLCCFADVWRVSHCCVVWFFAIFLQKISKHCHSLLWMLQRICRDIETENTIGSPYMTIIKQFHIHNSLAKVQPNLIMNRVLAAALDTLLPTRTQQTWNIVKRQSTQSNNSGHVEPGLSGHNMNLQ